MKWIGQHIWDLISRFRSDVYLDDVTAGTVASTDFLGVDSAGKIVKTTGGTSGGSLDTENIETTGSGIDDMEDVTLITFSGNHVQTFDQGNGNLLVNIGDAITGASGFSIASGAYFVNSFTNYNVAIPVDAAGKMFHKGTASNSIAVTDSTSFTFSTSTQRSKMEPVGGNNSKIEVTIRGANSNTSGGNNQILGSTIHEINNNGTTTDSATGITIQISSYVQDTIIDANSRKAIVAVTWDPSVLAGDHISANASGSQLYESISIKHTDNGGATISGSAVFTSTEKFFFDGSKVTPTYNGNPTVSILNPSATKLLSNILYYYNTGSSSYGVGWSGSQDGIAGFARDTYPTTSNHGTTTFDFPSGLQADSTADATISSHGFTNNEDGTFARSIYMSSNYVGLNKTVSFKVSSVEGGFSSNAGADTNIATTSAAKYISRGSTNSAVAEYFFAESYRIPEASIATVNTSSATLTTLQNNSMGSSASLASGKDHLIQTYNSYNSFKLKHPNDMGTVANLPVQVQWTGSAPSGSTYVEYYRYFNYSGSATSRVWDLGMTRAQYLQNYNNSKMEIWISRPGDNSYHNFIKMNPVTTYNSNDNTNSCYSGSQPASGSHFKAQFAGSSNLYIMKIRMKSGTTGAISKIVSI